MSIENENLDEVMAETSAAEKQEQVTEEKDELMEEVFAELGLDDESKDEDSETKESSESDDEDVEKETKQEAPKPKRKQNPFKNRYEEILFQRREAQEAADKATKELQGANLKIKELELNIKELQQVLSKYEDLFSQLESGLKAGGAEGEQAASGLSQFLNGIKTESKAQHQKPMTQEEIDELVDRRIKEKQTASIQEQEKQAVAKKIVDAWAPKLKEANEKLGDDFRLFMTEFLQDVDKSKVDVMLYLGDKDYATETLYAVYKDKNFKNLSLVDKIKYINKRNAQITNRKRAVTKSESIPKSNASAGVTTNSGRQSFAEYRKNKYQR